MNITPKELEDIIAEAARRAAEETIKAHKCIAFPTEEERVALRNFSGWYQDAVKNSFRVIALTVLVLSAIFLFIYNLIKSGLGISHG